MICEWSTIPPTTVGHGCMGDIPLFPVGCIIMVLIAVVLSIG